MGTDNSSVRNRDRVKLQPVVVFGRSLTWYYFEGRRSENSIDIFIISLVLRKHRCSAMSNVTVACTTTSGGLRVRKPKKRKEKEKKIKNVK